MDDSAKRQMERPTWVGRLGLAEVVELHHPVSMLITTKWKATEI
jgi:hypothetical protein